jgi:nicotinate dehydrogenase subunit B
MTAQPDLPRDRRDYMRWHDVLLVVRDLPDASSSLSDGEESVEIFVMVGADGHVTAFNGHVDLGTGIGTALGQIVAEELDVAFDRVTVVLGDPSRTPNQGATIASETIQITAVPLRQAAATARQTLLALAADRLSVSLSELRVEDGVVLTPKGGNLSISYGELITGKRRVVRIDPEAPLRPVAGYRVVGQPVSRVDLPAKATGQLVYVHDMRVPGMAHGRVVRPPYAGLDSGIFVGTSLIAVDESSLAGIPGILAVVTIGDFIGIVAEREEHAALAAQRLKVSWKPTPFLPDLSQIQTALRANPSTPRLLMNRGDVDAAIAGAALPMPRTYVWPYQMHGSIGPSCSLADFRPDGLTVWSGTQNPHVLRADIASLLQLPEERVEIIRMEAAGCYGRNCADDVSADAALLSRAVGRPIRVQLTREQEHAWEPKGAAQLMEVGGGLDAAGGVVGYDFSVRYPSNGAPILAALLTGAISPVPVISEMGDRTAIPPYGYEHMRVVAHDMPPIVRASWLRGVSSMPNSFAHESWIDEAAAAARVDPIAYRLRYLKDERAVDLIHAVAERANWVPHTEPGSAGGDGDVLRGRGFAYALYVHSKFPGYGAAWSAWVADVEVNKATGEVAVTHVTVGQDSGLMINPAGVRHQIHGNVIQSVSRVLKEEVAFTGTAVATRDWGTYPIITFPEVPVINVLMVPRPDQPPLGVGESASVPSAAAIANAIYDATGVRFRELPFTPERVRAGLEAAGITPAQPPGKVRRGFWAALGAGFAGLVGLATMALPLRAAIAPVAPADTSLYSAAAVARGRVLAGLGACAICHTVPGGAAYAGGLGIQTPFGTVYTPNITPDIDSGIGTWSYAAFDRAMRDGVSRDGHHLYPAFPYTDFTRATDADLQAIYAYLMAQAPVGSVAPQTALAFPFSLRPLMAAWNLLFHRPGAYQPDLIRSAQWNRGAYLVEGLGHCGACHTGRNLLGAERASRPMGGAVADGWEAPPLMGLSHAPIPWSEGELFVYLRTGYSALHGPAAGPMAPVIQELAGLPEADLRAMAHYLASSQSAPVTAETEARMVAEIKASTTGAMRISGGPGARIYQNACAFCHEAAVMPQFGVQPNLALNSNLHSASPDNLIRVILNGIQTPANKSLGAMPGFAETLNDAQLTDLVGFLRRQFAPGKPEWPALQSRIARLRAETSAS